MKTRDRQLAVLERCDTANARETTINAILAAARKPVPEIAEIRHLLCSDGMYWSPFGIPFGVTVDNATPAKVVGYAYRDGVTGTTFGTRRQTREELVKSWNAWQDKQEAEFRAILEAGSAEELATKAAYWLKK